MTTFMVSDTRLLDQPTEGLLFFVEDGAVAQGKYAELSTLYCSHLIQLMEDQGFTGKLGQTLVAQGTSGKKIKYLIFVGLGKKKEAHYDLEEYRRLLATGIRVAHAYKIKTLALTIPNTQSFGESVQFMAQTTVVISQMTAYCFDEFVTKKETKAFHCDQILLVVPAQDVEAAKAGVNAGNIIAEAVNTARHWVDLPANMLSTSELVKKAEFIAEKHALDITIFNEAQIEKMGMGGLKAVGMGSQHDAYLVVLEYSAKRKNAPTIALVGKGITFDSGGLNIKPTAGMETMKEDMAGAAAVINAIGALASLHVDVNVVALAAIAENMVSGNANHPGDIITFYNGITAVVGNTDAEGRLVLADALAYADKHFKPTAMIDIATLTGAASHAVGPYFNCVLTQNDDLAQKVAAAGVTSGDATWRLPLIDRYKKMVKAEVADICNDGKTKYYAGPTNGACFLSHFVGETPWVHLDIAPTAFDVPDVPYYGPGATGSGTRLLIDFVMQWK